MHKKEYVKKISEKLNLSQKNVEMITDAFIQEMIDSIIKKDKVSITHMGTFQKTLIIPKDSFSPIDGSTIHNNKYYRISFSGSNELLQKLKSDKN